MPRKNPPLLVESGLTHTIYVVTRYTTDGDGRITASEKFDVTEQFESIASRRSPRASGVPHE